MYELLNINAVSESDYEFYYSLMSNERKSRIDSFRFDGDKKRSVCGEMLARRMISGFCSIPEREIIFETDRRGKPYAVNADAEFSISHSGDFVLCSVSKNSVGADIETIREVKDKLIKYVCSEKESGYVFSAQNDLEKYKRFFEVWTAKEAYYKYLGTGIAELKNTDTLDPEFKAHVKTYITEEYVISIYQ